MNFKFYLTTIVLIGIANLLLAQSIYYDANRLARYAKEKKNPAGQTTIAISPSFANTKDTAEKRLIRDSILSTLKLYFPTINITDNSDVITTAIQSNPFLKFVSFNGQVQGIHADAASITLFNGSSNVNNLSPSGLSALNVSSFASGIAQFLVNRAKEELTIAFFDRFKKFADNHAEFQILFPNTYGNLTTFPSYNYQQWLPVLREGFYKDVQGITGKLNKTFDTPDFKSLSAKFPEATIVIRVIGLVDTLKNGMPVVDALDKLAKFPEFAIISNSNDSSIDLKNFVNGLQLLNILSQSVKASGAEHSATGWVSANDINSLISSPIASQLFLGLLYQQVSNEKVQFYSTIVDTSKKSRIVSESFAAIMTKNSSGILQSVSVNINKIITIGKGVDSIYNIINSIKKGDTIKKDDYFNYINTLINVFEKGFDIVGQLDTHLTNNVHIGEYITIARKIDDIYQDIYRKEYPQAVLNLVYILNTVNNGKNNSISKLSSDLTTYGLLIANLVTAKSSSDVQTAIQNAVLPVGSYSVKQNSDCNISLNGYIGYAYDLNNHFNNVYAKGIYAPIGFSFSTNIWETVPTTLFIGVIDVGSIVSYQLTNNNVNTTSSTGTTSTTNTSSLSQQIKLGSIFSPSAEVFFEIPKWPFAIGGGWRRTPTLFYSGGTTYGTVGAQNVFNVAILIDIPLITFHNKPFNKNTKK